MILSDTSLRAAIASGHIGIEPFDAALVQPSSIDVRVDSMFRVFRNHTAGVIDVKVDLSGLTELVEIPDDGVFMLHPGEFVLGSTLERLSVPDDLVARVEGKALSVATPIPTPQGWADLGDLQVGDSVFTHTGEPTRVKDVTEVMLGRPCYEIVLSDGSVFIADASHEWITMSIRSGRAAPIVQTTCEIAASLANAPGSAHHIPFTEPVRCPHVELPIDPSVLGAWLVDRSMSALIGDGRVPPTYLRASVDQRAALLEGLTADAECGDADGRTTFTTIDETLAIQVAELVASLGRAAVVAKVPTVLGGLDVGPTYNVTFAPLRPHSGLTVTCVHPEELDRFERSHAIVAARPTASVPVRCIEVDHPDGVYLAGRSFVPTHNSSLGRLGLLIHSTAGFVDSGFSGHITLELANVASLPITIYPGMKIGQVSFMQMTTPAEQPYGKGALGSKYQGQRGPTPSRYFENFRGDDS